MHSAKLFSLAALALGTAVQAASKTTTAASTCTSDVTITEATQTIDCDVVSGDIKISSTLTGDVTVDGPTEILGDFIVNNASGLISLTSTTIEKISGTFELEDLEDLSTLEFSSLTSVGTLTMIKLTQLSSLDFGTDGVTSITSITISDTFLSDLSGLSVNTVENFQIDNNKQITKFDSDLVNITGSLIINNNGNDFEIIMDSLETAAEFQISNVKSFSAPLLTSLTESIKFDTNDELTTISLPNLTSVTDDVSFINNVKLTNISIPALTTIGGGFTIQNNTDMDTIDGFAKLKEVGGAIILRGNFTEISLPDLDDVKGSVTIVSTGDISSSCTFFKSLRNSDKILGEETCTSNDDDANSSDDNGTSTSSSSSSSDSDDAAGMTSVSFTVLGLAFVAAVAQLL